MAIALFLLPALVLYAIFVLFPIVQAVRYSFFKWNGLTPLTDFIGLKNYQAGRWPTPSSREPSSTTS